MFYLIVSMNYNILIKRNHNIW